MPRGVYDRSPEAFKARAKAKKAALPNKVQVARIAAAKKAEPPKPIVEPQRLAPRQRGQSMDPLVRQKVWQNRMVEGYSIPATATMNGVSESYVKKITTGQQVGSADYRRKAFSGPIPYKALIPEAKKAYDDVAFFAERYFGLILMPWHVEAAETIRQATETEHKEYIVTNCPPGAGKSTLVTLVIPAWLTVRNRAIRGMIVSNSQRNAERYTDALRRAFAEALPVRASERDLRLGIAKDAKSSLLRDFGVFKAPNADSGQVWSRKEFQVLQHEGTPVNEKEPTWSAFGMGGVFMGNRVDVILADDAYDKSANRTTETRAYTKEWFTVNVETRLEPGGVLMATGQRQHADDLYRFLLDKADIPDEDVDSDVVAPKMYRHITYKAHYQELCTGEHVGTKPYPEGCLLYPARLAWRDLRKVQINDPQVWSVEYQQEDSDASQALVKPEWVYGGKDPYTGVEYQGCVDKDRDEWELPAGLSGLFVWAAADPSPTRFWSIQLWAYHPATEQRFLIAHHRGKMDAPDLLDFRINDGEFMGLMQDWQVRSKAMGIPVSHWVIENNAAQRFLMQYDWAKKWQAIHGCHVVGHNTNFANKSDPTLGVQAMASVWRQGKIRLPWKHASVGWANAKKLVDEMLVWPDGGTDDCVMAAWFGEWQLPRLYTPVLERPYQFQLSVPWRRGSAPQGAPTPMTVLRSAM